MKKAMVVYESRYGSTRRYAQWIAEELACPLCERKAFHPQDLADCEVIIYGGGLYAGGVNGIRFLAKNEKLLSGKTVILYTCGLADPQNSDNISRIRAALAKALPPRLLAHTKVFHLRGGIDYSRLGPVHRAMMAMLRKMLLKKDAASLSGEDRQLLETYGKCVDFTDRESIRPLIRCAKAVCGK